MEGGRGGGGGGVRNPLLHLLPRLAVQRISLGVSSTICEIIASIDFACVTRALLNKGHVFVSTKRFKTRRKDHAGEVMNVVREGRYKRVRGM